jgi:hypothetical protein
MVNKFLFHSLLNLPFSMHVSKPGFRNKLLKFQEAIYNLQAQKVLITYLKINITVFNHFPCLSDTIKLNFTYFTY